VGISFYTFQSLGYMVDVYRGQTEAEKNLITYALFVAFFPQVQAGPIGRSTSLLPQLRADAPRFSAKRAEQGLFMVGWGVFKKLMIADRLAVFVNAVFDEYGGGTGAVSLAALLLFAFQIYCDFSSYSTIALGTAKILGYELEQNFNLPYLARTLPDFWRRWHITLGSWFRDYLFYPILRGKPLNRLAESAKKSLPKAAAQNLPVAAGLLVVWLCTGLWHGAGWNYIVWGLYHGLFLILSALLGPVFKRRAQKWRLPTQTRLYKIFQTLRTFFLVCAGYVFFRSAGLRAAVLFFKNLFGGARPAALWDGSLLAYGLDAADFTVALAALALLFVLELVQRRVNLLQWLPAQKLPLRWAVYLLGLLAIAVFGVYGEGYAEKPFIYFQF
jgi:D-alanyl-lipoteichoic acid acyltransferase DltB (MBOAT superfamily)